MADLCTVKKIRAGACKRMCSAVAKIATMILATVTCSIYYPYDRLVLDVYACCPYLFETGAECLFFQSPIPKANLLLTSVLGTGKAEEELIPLLFGHLLSKGYLSV